MANEKIAMLEEMIDRINVAYPNQIEPMVRDEFETLKRLRRVVEHLFVNKVVVKDEF